MKKLVLIRTIFIMLALVATSIVSVSPVYAAPDVETLRPNAVGFITGWLPFGDTNNWQCVDEVTPDDTTYIYTTGNNKHDSYNLEDHTKGSGAISLVRVYARALSVVAGEEISIEIVIGGTTYTGAKEILTTSYIDYYQDWAQHPVGPADWTWSDIDALEAGVRSYVTSDEIRVTTVWIEVTYTPDWNSYESDYTTSCETYTGALNTIYMKGTGFADTGKTYIVKYYDATPTLVTTDSGVSPENGGVLKSSLACNFDPGATAGTWSAKVYLSDGTTLIAEDTFTVNQDVIPEFPTIFAAIGVAGLCFGIYLWMRKRRLVYVKA